MYECFYVSNLYIFFPVIIIPSDSTADLHICGTCRAQFYLIEAFVDHKLRGCATLREIDKSGNEYGPPTISVAEPIRFTDALGMIILYFFSKEPEGLSAE